MDIRWILLAGVLVLAAALALACTSDTVSTTATVATTVTTATTAPPSTQTTAAADDTYRAQVQAWLDTYAADLEKAFAAQGDPLDTWKETARQLASAKAAADLAREANDSLRAIQPPSRSVDAQRDYSLALGTVAAYMGDLARGDLFSAGYGWPPSQFLVEARQTFVSTVPDDDYGAQVQAWLDTYAADLEKAFAAQGDPADTWKRAFQQIQSAAAAADLVREANDSLRAIQPPSRWAGAQATYVEALDRVARHLDDLGRGDVFSAVYGWPESQFLVEARQTFMSEVLDLSASAAFTPTTTIGTYDDPSAGGAAWCITEGGVEMRRSSIDLPRLRV